MTSLQDLKSKNHLNIDTSKSVLSTYPTHAEADVTTKCNANCQMCYWRAAKTPHHEIEFGTFKSFMDACGDYLITVTMSGPGEAFLHPRFRDMCEIVAKHEAHFSVVTNGSLLDTVMDLMESIGGNITVSIDTTDPDVYEEIRRGLKWDKVYGNLVALSELSRGRTWPKVTINYCVMNNTIDRMKDMAVLADKLGLYGIRFLYGNVGGFDAEKWGKMDPDDKGIIDSLVWIQKTYPNLVVYDQCTSKTNLCMTTEGSLCKLPWNSILLNYDGGMYPCCKYTVPLMSGQREETRRMGTMPMSQGQEFLRDVWNSKVMTRMRGLIQTNPKEWPPDFAWECMNCLKFSGLRK